MDDRYSYSTPARRGLAGPILLIGLAFVAGIALAAWTVHRWDKVANWLHPAPQSAVAPVQQPRPTPLPVAAIPATPGADPAIGQQVEALDEKVDALDAKTQQASGDADRAEGLLIAFAARRAVDRGQPLGYLEGLLHQHFARQEAQSVTMVIGAAQKPVTLLQLQNGYAALAPQLVTPGPEEGWWTGVKREIGGLFVVRKAQTPSAEPAEQQARAARALDQGAVEEAMSEVLRMPGGTKAKAWIEQARRYVLVHNALDRIEAAALLERRAEKPTDSAN